MKQCRVYMNLNMYGQILFDVISLLYLNNQAISRII